MTKKQEWQARNHRERMTNDLDYRSRKLLNTVRARCLSGNGRKDWQWYGAKGLQVTLTLEEIKRLWFRDGAAQMKRPDLDRKENGQGYTFENCRFIEHADNIRRMIPTRKPRGKDLKPRHPQGE